MALLNLPKGVCLQSENMVCPQDGEFVPCAPLNRGESNFVDPLFVDLFHGMAVDVPIAEVSGDGNLSGARRPDGKTHRVATMRWIGVGSKAFPKTEGRVLLFLIHSFTSGPCP